MIEIPESATIGKQASETLKGKRIAHVIESNSPHRFTFYNGDPAEYSNRLVGRTVLGAQGYGAFVDILMDATLVIGIVKLAFESVDGTIHRNRES